MSAFLVVWYLVIGLFGIFIFLLKFLKSLFIVLQHIISCVLAIKPDGFLLSEAFIISYVLVITPDGFLLSEAFFEERSSTFC